MNQYEIKKGNNVDRPFDIVQGKRLVVSCAGEEQAMAILKTLQAQAEKVKSRLR